VLIDHGVVPDWSGSLRWLRVISSINLAQIRSPFWPIRTFTGGAATPRFTAPCASLTITQIPASASRRRRSRYGFHGLSYEDVAKTWPQISTEPQGRVDRAHLGRGASLCALKQDRSAERTWVQALEGFQGERGLGNRTLASCSILFRKGCRCPTPQNFLYPTGLTGLS